MQNLKQWKMDSPIGPLYLIASEKGLKGIFWKKSKIEFLSKPDGVILKAYEELRDYFEGKRLTFTIPLELDGTEFQKKVWKTLLKIPFGKTYSYSDIARKIGNPRAIRAVASANAKNPLCIIVPCHRVIASNGSLAGYSGGIDVKRQLLTLEGSIPGN